MSELKFCALEIMGECTSRRLFSYGGFQFMFQLEEFSINITLKIVQFNF